LEHIADVPGSVHQIYHRCGRLLDVIHWMRNSFILVFVCQDSAKHSIPLDEINNLLEQMMHLDKNIVAGRAPVIVYRLWEQLLQFTDIIIG
jgi:hypothetical protein